MIFHNYRRILVLCHESPIGLAVKIFKKNTNLEWRFKSRGYLISRVVKKYILRLFNFAVWSLQNISRVCNLAIPEN